MRSGAEKPYLADMMHDRFRPACAHGRESTKPRLVHIAEKTANEPVQRESRVALLVKTLRLAISIWGAYSGPVTGRSHRCRV